MEMQTEESERGKETLQLATKQWVMTARYLIKRKLHENEMLTFLKSQSITSDRTKI